MALLYESNRNPKQGENKMENEITIIAECEDNYKFGYRNEIPVLIEYQDFIEVSEGDQVTDSYGDKYECFDNKWFRETMNANGETDYIRC